VAPELTEAERERLRRWWLDRYSIDELLELGRGWLVEDRGRKQAETAP